MKKLILYLIFSCTFIYLNAQQGEFYSPNSLEPENFSVDQLSSIATWEASGDTTVQPIHFKLFLSDTLYAEVPGDEFSLHFACLTYNQEYTASIQAVYDWTDSDKVNYTWQSFYLPTIQVPFVSNVSGYVEFTFQVIPDCFTNPNYPDGLISFNLYMDGINIANIPFEPGIGGWVTYISDPLLPGTYVYCAGAIYDLGIFGFPGEEAQSALECDTIQITWVGVDNHPSCDIVRIYPNPASDQITISSYSEISKIAVFDQLGNQVLIVDRLFSQKEILDISILYPGIYILKITTEKGIVNKRVVKM